MKKVALFLPSLAGGGAEKAMIQLANALVARNYNVDLVVVKAKGEYKGQVNVNVNLVDLKKTRLVLSLIALIRYLKSSRPDLLYASMTHSSLIAAFAKWMSRAPVSVFAREESILKRANFKDKFCVFLAKYVYRRIDGVITCSEGLKNELIKLLGVSSEKVECIYNPFDFERIRRLSEAPLNLASPSSCGLTAGSRNENAAKSLDPTVKPQDDGVDKYILAAGRLVEQKDYPTLLKAFAIVRKKIDDLHLVILGKGKLKATLEALAIDLGIKDRVLFLGFQQNPYTYMKHASTFVLSSKNEGLACVLMEALLCGCPVVSTDCPVGPREILQQGRLGMLVPVGDSEALANAIEATLQANQRVQFDGNYFDRFKLDFIVDQYVRLFQLQR